MVGSSTFQHSSYIFNYTYIHRQPYPFTYPIYFIRPHSYISFCQRKILGKYTLSFIHHEVLNTDLTAVAVSQEDNASKAERLQNCFFPTTCLHLLLKTYCQALTPNPKPPSFSYPIFPLDSPTPNLLHLLPFPFIFPLTVLSPSTTASVTLLFLGRPYFSVHFITLGFNFIIFFFWKKSLLLKSVSQQLAYLSLDTLQKLKRKKWKQKIENTKQTLPFSFTFSLFYLSVLLSASCFLNSNSSLPRSSFFLYTSSVFVFRYRFLYLFIHPPLLFNFCFYFIQIVCFCFTIWIFLILHFYISLFS